MSIKYEKLGLRRDLNLSDLNDKSAGLTNLLNNLALPGETFIGPDLLVINNISDTNVKSADFLNFVGIAIDSTQIRYQLRLKVETPSATISFEQGTKFIYNGIEFEVIVYTTPAPPEATGNVNNNYELELLLQSPTDDEVVSVGDTIGINNQPFIVMDILVNNVKTQNVFTVSPLLTLRDQTEYFRLNTGYIPKFGYGGDGPDAKFYPWVTVNPFADLTFTGAPDYAIDGHSYIDGQQLIEHTGNTFTPTSYGPFKFWDRGSFIFGSNIFDTNRFNDGAGLIQWEGYYALPSWTWLPTELTVITNGDFLWEQYREDLDKWVVAGAKINGYSGKVVWSFLDEVYYITNTGFDTAGNPIRPGNAGVSEGSILADEFIFGRPARIDAVEYNAAIDAWWFGLEYTEFELNLDGWDKNVLDAPVVADFTFVKDAVQTGQGTRFETISDIGRSDFTTSKVVLYPSKVTNEKTRCRLTVWFPQLPSSLTYSDKMFNVKDKTSEGVKFTRWFSSYNVDNEASNLESLNYYNDNAVDSYNEKIEGSLNVDGLITILDEPQTTKKHWNNARDHLEYHTSTILPSTNVLDRTSIYPSVANFSANVGALGFDYSDNSLQTIKRGDLIITWQDVYRCPIVERYKQLDGETKSYVITRPYSDGLLTTLQQKVNDESIPTFNISLSKILASGQDSSSLGVFMTKSGFDARNQNVNTYFEWPPLGLQRFSHVPSVDGRAPYEDELGVTENALILEQYLGIPATQSLVVATEGVIDVWFEDNSGVVSLSQQSEDNYLATNAKYVNENDLVYTLYIPSDDFYSNYWAQVIHTVTLNDTNVYNSSTGEFTITEHGFAHDEIVQVSDQDSNALGNNTRHNYYRVNKIDNDTFFLRQELNTYYASGAYTAFGDANGGTTVIFPQSNASIGIYSYGAQDSSPENEDLSITPWYVRTLGDRSDAAFETKKEYALYSDTAVTIIPDLATGIRSVAPFEQQHTQWVVTFDPADNITVGGLGGFGAGVPFSIPIMLDFATNTDFEKVVLNLEWDVSNQQWLLTSSTPISQPELAISTGTQLAFLKDITLEFELTDENRLLKYNSGAVLPYWDMRMSTAESYTDKTQKLVNYSYDETTNEVTYEVNNFLSIPAKDVLTNKNGRNNTGVDIDPNPRFIHIIQSSKTLQDYSKLSFCEGVIGTNITANVSVGSTSIPVDDITGIGNGMIVQFNGYIPNATVVTNVSTGAGTAGTITLSSAVTKELKQNYVLTVSNDNLQNYELCNASLDTAPPFEGNETGLETVAGFENLQVNELIFRTLNVENTSSTQIDPVIDGFDYDNEMNLNYIDETTGTKRTFKLMIK